MQTVDQQHTTKKLYIESYGCQMNFADSEIVASVLSKEGFGTTQTINDADLVLLNTCSIRDKAEQTIRKRLKTINAIKKNKPNMTIGILGCMAQRLKEKFLEEEKIVDLVTGPDSYRDLPKLIEDVKGGNSAVNTLLSKEETYGDISPVRLGTNGITAFVSITRGCDNFCTFCVVPFTRGRERSREPQTIIKEIQELANKGYKEVTLLGQNVDSYLWYGGGAKKDFPKASDIAKATAVNFAQLLEMVAMTFPNIRIRFSTSNPQDMTDDVLYNIAKYDNICNHIHLPVQTGSSRLLQLMHRGHNRPYYEKLIAKIRNIIHDCAITHDMIIGYPTETEKDHKETLSLMEYVKYSFGYMFAYSERSGTKAARVHKDDVPKEVKSRRLTEVIDLQSKHSMMRTKERVGNIEKILVESESKKSEDDLYGRNSQNMPVVFPRENYKAGDFVNVKIIDCTSATLKGQALELVNM